MPPLTTAIVAFVLNGGAYLAEILRSSIDAVPAGQWERMLSRFIERRTYQARAA